MKAKQIIQETDTFDRAGSVVRRLKSDTIALTLYTDGGQLTVSTSHSVWPVILWLNELPGKVQQSFKNAAWVSLWFRNIFKPLQKKIFTKLRSWIICLILNRH